MNTHLEASTNVLLVGEYQWYYLDVAFLNGRPDQQSTIDYGVLNAVDKLSEQLHVLGVTHVLLDRNAGATLVPVQLRQLVAGQPVLYQGEGHSLFLLP